MMTAKCQKVQETQGFLDKLKRNLEQMSKEQCTFYKKNLQALKVRILQNAILIAQDYLFGDIFTLAGDSKCEQEINARIAAVMRTEIWKSQVSKLKTILFKTYSVQSFLNALIPLRVEILYKAYGPYWISKTERDQVTGQIRNRVLDAWSSDKTFFSEKRGTWEKKTFFWSVTDGRWESTDREIILQTLPPDMDRLRESYNQWRKRNAGKTN